VQEISSLLEIDPRNTQPVATRVDCLYIPTTKGAGHASGTEDLKIQAGETYGLGGGGGYPLLKITSFFVPFFQNVL